MAKAAGTSMAVVSYVVNGGPRPVATATRQRVLDAIQRTGYRPDGIARALVGGSTLTLGLVVPDIANEFFAELAGAVEQTARAAGRTVLLASSEGNTDSELALLETLLQRRIDGVVIISQAPELADELLEQGNTRRVFLGAAPEHGSSIGVDNTGGAFAATQHLLEHGYERIALIGGPAGDSVAEDRLIGWQQAMGDREAHFVHQPFTVDGGYVGALELLGSATPPQAVFAASDRQAIGLLRAAADEGLSVPDDLAVVTFDGSAASAYAVPSLTTIQQPITEMAELAVRQLLDLHADPIRAVLDVALVVRRSCGCSSARP